MIKSMYKISTIFLRPVYNFISIFPRPTYVALFIQKYLTQIHKLIQEQDTEWQSQNINKPQKFSSWISPFTHLIFHHSCHTLLFLSLPKRQWAPWGSLEISGNQNAYLNIFRLHTIIRPIANYHFFTHKLTQIHQRSNEKNR